MEGNIGFETPSRLKPRYLPEGSTSISSYFENNSKANRSYDKNEDNLSISETIMNMWRKGRKKHKRRSRSYKKESPKVFLGFVTAAKGLLVLFFIAWNAYLYNETVHKKTEEVATVIEISEEDRQRKIDKYFKAANIDHLKKLRDQEINVPRFAVTPSKIRPHNPFLPIPENIEVFYQDVNSTVTENDVPVFWHILKSGGTSMKDILGECMGKVEAAESGVMSGHLADTELQIVSFQSNIQYVNVDTTTADGIQRAIRMNLIQSGLADVIVSPLLHQSSLLFNNTKHQGRIFGLFRHPIDRAASLFYYLKKATWEPTFSEKLKRIKTIEDYAISEYAENNWMVRFLTNKMGGMITKADLAIAKEVLRRKVLIGLVLDVRGASERVMSYFGWDFHSFTPDQQKCMNREFSAGSNKNHHQKVEEGSMAWRILRSNNLLDLELYDYALQLYYEQGQMLGISQNTN